MMTEVLDPSLRNEVDTFELMEKLPPTTFEEKQVYHVSSVFVASIGSFLDSCISFYKLVTKE